MNAKEMLNALGFEKVTHINDDEEIFQIDYMKVDMMLEFWIKDKKYYFEKNTPSVSIELHKAIHQQLIELGWI